ncbi:MAG: ATP-binding protein [Limnohabitans sp.]|nr:ATP-binding protein [Limnohabitans sp.]
MNKTKSVSTYTKILLLILVSSFLFLTLFFSIYYYTNQQEKKVYQSSRLQFQNEINALLKLNSESQIAVIKDITYWDELVQFVNSQDKDWFKNSLSGVLKLYKADYIGVYDLEGKFISSASTDKIKSSDFLETASLVNLQKQKILNYYQVIPDGVIEVFAATIHPSNDPYKIKTEPAGYLFIARSLDQNYILELQNICNSKIYIDKEDKSFRPNKNRIPASFALFDWNKEKIASINFERNFNFSFNSTKKTLWILVIVLSILLTLVIFYLRTWIFTPLKLVTRILETNNKKAIKVLKNSSGEFGYIGNLFDINIKQQKQLEVEKSKAEQSDKLKTAFLTNLSHEIRTPMNAILGFSDLLDSDYLNEIEKKEYLKIIKNSGKNLVSIIDDLIEMSKIDSNLVKPKATSIYIDEFMEELYNSLKVAIPKEKKIALILVKSSLKIGKKVITDEVKLRQIITNLIINAFKFTNSGYVKLSYQWNDFEDKLEFSVEDTGIGIEKENQELIFDRFRRVDGDYSIKVGGLGLGLAITKAYVEMLNGSISLTSELGKGSKFSFSIPIVYDVSSEKEEKGEKYSEGVGIKKLNSIATILIAEDDNINFLLFQKLIKDYDCNVVRARDGEEAVDFAKNRNDIDIILMDIKMPRLSGFDAFIKIRSFNKNIPIIAQTAFSASEEINKIKELGFDGYITKPIDKNKLFMILNNVLDKNNV